jgi:hypothetical protein
LNYSYAYHKEASFRRIELIQALSVCCLLQGSRKEIFLPLNNTHLTSRATIILL